VQEVKTWPGYHFPFLFFHEVAMLLWLMMGHYGTDNVVSDGQCEAPVSVLLSVHPLDEGFAVHSRPACLQRNKNSNLGVRNPTVFCNVKPKVLFT
jgi:hypothetical protein